MAQNAEKQVLRVIIRFGPRTVAVVMMYHVLNSEGMHVLLLHNLVRRHANDTNLPNAPYRSASALNTSQLTPPTLIHRTLAHGSRLLASGEASIWTSWRFVIRPTLHFVIE